MTQLRIHNLTEIEEVIGNEKLVIDESSLSNALSLTLNKLATWVLGRTTSETHAETLYYNYIAEREYFDGEAVVIQGPTIFIGIALDHVQVGETLRIAYAGKCKALVNKTYDVVAGDFAVMITDVPSTHYIGVGDGTELTNRVGVFLETSAGGEDRLVWVLLKL